MTRAAFYAVIVASERTPNGMDELHVFAITTRNSGAAMARTTPTGVDRRRRASRRRCTE